MVTRVHFRLPGGAIRVDLAQPEDRNAVEVFSLAPLTKGSTLLLSPTSGVVLAASGHYEFTGLSPGRYRVRVAAEGFQDYEAEVVVGTAVASLEAPLQPR